MIQNVLRHLGGIENYGIASLLIFVLVFSAMVIWALLQRRTHVERMARLPLDTENNSFELGKDSQ